MGHWVYETHDGKFRYGYWVEEVLYSGRSGFQKIDVVQTAFFGRMLLLDDLVMTTEKDEFIYHDMISHIPLLAHPDPRRVLVIGGGDGGTVREVLKHPSVEEVVLCEIDGEVIEVSKRFLPTISGALDDPRVTVEVADGAAYIANHPNSFDAILVDSTDPFGPGAQLFNAEFYTRVKEALRPGGVVANQSESPVSQQPEVTETNTLLNQVFPIVRPYTACVPTYPGGQWTWTFSSSDREPLAELERDDHRAAAIEAEARYYNRSVHRAAFALPNYVRALIQPDNILKPYRESQPCR